MMEISFYNNILNEFIKAAVAVQDYVIPVFHSILRFFQIGKKMDRLSVTDRFTLKDTVCNTV